MVTVTAFEVTVLNESVTFSVNVAVVGDGARVVELNWPVALSIATHDGKLVPP